MDAEGGGAVGAEEGADLVGLGLADLHGEGGAGLELGQPQPGDGPVEAEAVRTAVQGQGGLFLHLGLEGGQLLPGDVGGVGGQEIQAVPGEAGGGLRGEDIAPVGGDLVLGIGGGVFLQVAEGQGGELQGGDLGLGQEGAQPQPHGPGAGAQVQALGGWGVL